MQGNKSTTQKQTPYITTIDFRQPKSSIKENKDMFGMRKMKNNMFSNRFLTSWVKEFVSMDPEGI